MSKPSMSHPKVILKECNKMHKIMAESDQLQQNTRQADLSVEENFAYSNTKPSTTSPPASDILTNKMPPNNVPGGNISANNTSEKPMIISALLLPATPQSLIKH